MSTFLYEKPVKIELKDSELFVDGKQHPKDVRKLSELEDVMMEEPEIDMIGDLEMYYMYRSVRSSGNIRFDITVIPPRVVDKEYAKTFGHEHPEAEPGITYPEVYQVLKGKAVFILQQKNRNGSVNASIISAVENDVLLIPPNFGHVTINPGKDPLVLSNLVCSDFSSLYEDFRKNKGAAYYYLDGGDVQQNPNYFIQNTERMSAQEFNQRYGFPKCDLLEQFSEGSDRFEFLVRPGLIMKKG